MKKKINSVHLSLVLLVLCLLTTGALLGKYVTDTELKSGTVEFSAKLAESIVVREHKVDRAPNGEYILSASDADDAYITDKSSPPEQGYILIPGVDIPKDPEVVITGKTDIPAYLFVEVVKTYSGGTPVDPASDPVTYEVRDCWKKVVATDNLRQPQSSGTDLYVYSTIEGKPIVIKGDGTAGTPVEYPILEGDMVYVSQHLRHMNHTASITFKAYLDETAAYPAVP